jgi:hypothetical protein
MKRRVLGVFKPIAGARVAGREKTLVEWQPAGRNFPRLAGVQVQELAGRSGLYLLWHLGVRPRWVRAGFTLDLGAAVTFLAKTSDVLAFEPHEGPYFSWSLCLPGEAAGFVNFLAARLNPVLQHQRLACDMILDTSAPAISCALPAGTKEVQTALNNHAHRN